MTCTLKQNIKPVFNRAVLKKKKKKALKRIILPCSYFLLIFQGLLKGGRKIQPLTKVICTIADISSPGPRTPMQLTSKELSVPTMKYPISINQQVARDSFESSGTGGENTSVHRCQGSQHFSKRGWDMCVSRFSKPTVQFGGCY